MHDNVFNFGNFVLLVLCKLEKVMFAGHWQQDTHSTHINVVSSAPFLPGCKQIITILLLIFITKSTLLPSPSLKKRQHHNIMPPPPCTHIHTLQRVVSILTLVVVAAVLVDAVAPPVISSFGEGGMELAPFLPLPPREPAPPPLPREPRPLPLPRPLPRPVVGSTAGALASESSESSLCTSSG